MNDIKLTRFEATNIFGIICKLLSVVFFVSMASLIKQVSAIIPAGEAVFFRSFFALPVIFCWLIFSSNFQSGLKIVSLYGHLWRGFVGTTAMGFMFLGLGLLPLPEVTAIGYSAPILTVLFAILILKESVRLFRLGAVVLGFIGVLIILYPRLSVVSLTNGLSFEELGGLFVLMGAFFMALAHIYIRKLTATETASSIVFYFTISSCFWSLLTIPTGWIIPDYKVFSLLALSGVLGGFGQIFLTQAYKYSEASVVAPFEYLSIIFSMVIGYFIFKEMISLSVVIGSGIIIFSGLIIIWREHELGIAKIRLEKSI